MSTIVEDIRASIKGYKSTTVFNYGRPADTALAAANLDVDDWFAHMDPVSTDGTPSDSNLSSPVVLGFLRQDSPDSEYDQENNLAINDSIEKLQSDAQAFAIGWYNYFIDNYGKRYTSVSYNITPATRVKNVMSGVLFRTTFTYKGSC